MSIRESYGSMDDVSGTIVGGDHGVCWISYEGRAQKQPRAVKSRREAVCACEQMLCVLKSDLGSAFSEIYPDENAWKMHSSRHLT